VPALPDAAEPAPPPLPIPEASPLPKPELPQIPQPGMVDLPKPAAPPAPKQDSPPLPKAPAQELPKPEIPALPNPESLPPLPKTASAEVKHEARLTSLPHPAQTGQDKREPLVDALQCVLENRHNEALKYLQKYDQPTQELFLRLLPAMSLLTHKGIDQLSSAEIAVLHDQVHGLLCALRPRTELAISKACFCEWVKAYGIYKPLPEGHGFLAPNTTRPGELVQLYVELRNFTSELQNGFYTTKLSSSVEIHDVRDPKGKPLWFYRFDDHKQPLRSRTMVQDYFNNYSFYVPNLPPGNYILTVQIADETRERRLARKSLEFRVTAIAPAN
jgi:hypothetical protein